MRFAARGGGPLLGLINGVDERGQRSRSRLILFGGGTFDRFSGLSSTEGPAINDVGQVVFLAILAYDRRGVFVVEPTTLPIQIP